MIDRIAGSIQQAIAVRGRYAIATESGRKSTTRIGRTMPVLAMLTLFFECVASVQAQVPVGSFQDVVPIAELDSDARDDSPSISPDGLTLYFASDRPGGYGDRDLWMATRPTKNSPFGSPVNLGPTVNSPGADRGTSISADGLTLYFHSDRSAVPGLTDLWMTTRASTADPFGVPVNLGPTVNSEQLDQQPNISPDNLTLHFHSDRPGGSGDTDLWITTRAAPEAPFTEPTSLGQPVNSDASDRGPNISADELTMFFYTDRESEMFFELWVTTRGSTNEPWGAPINLDDFSLGSVINARPGSDFTPYISPDWPANGSTLYFASATSRENMFDFDLYQATWVVPEPSALALAAFGCLGLAAYYVWHIHRHRTPTV